MIKIIYFILFLFIGACSVEEETTTIPAGNSDGTASAPAVLTVGTALSGGIAYNGYSYYQFTTSATGDGNYNLAIDSMVITDGITTYGVDTTLYSNSGFSNVVDYESCAGSCTLNFDYDNLNASTSYYLLLSGWGVVTYSLTVSKGGSEGSVANPVELTLATAHSGTIDNIDGVLEDGYSYYKFTTAASTDNYTLTMTNSDSLNCSLYSNAAFSNTVSSSYSDCTEATNITDTFTGTTSSGGLSASTAYYLRIEGATTTAKTTTYDITVAAEGN
jgi:hypothetical protein